MPKAIVLKVKGITFVCQRIFLNTIQNNYILTIVLIGNYLIKFYTMPDAGSDQQNNKLTHTKKIWTVGSILSFIVFLLLIKILFSVLLLILAGVIIAVNFYGFAGLIKKYLHLSSR